MNVSWILHRDFLEGNKKGHRFTLAVALYILTLRLPIPIPLKYPARVWFLGGGGFTPGKHGPEKVRGQSVDIRRKPTTLYMT